MREIVPYLRAANVDLKSFRESYYKKLCGARLEPVLAAIREYKKLEGVGRAHHLSAASSLRTPSSSGAAWWARWDCGDHAFHRGQHLKEHLKEEFEEVVEAVRAAALHRIHQERPGSAVAWIAEV